ncbi:MAG: efflux RND transporter periplasmic adaptor subunit [Bacteroidota bacterium]|jgi:multidrug efflux pump subunit AcrA (membrane-fusion protein)|nr:HlyD family efflux transporter periplasmic adaptor subunit [Ignavibacteria bacterium]MCU7500038.1 HlyD family efflux transporter periplasmic adaptor subunit [Ignavibacteria bacterium]MCU7513775.1 HlyD family efflux transporter periplasmic adaptor subunit [Ignavibacteria bacterium]MCU7521994.1 HlyD family efflux transporter periplasmic adaptor subunit [Ignavibacteria bacterium]MCU7525292.1 HlyD family efflux transporter periplasmic adaptor subunit [Ignavibacteria bacterium]
MRLTQRSALIFLYLSLLLLPSCAKKDPEEEQSSEFRGASVSLIHPVVENMTEFIDLNATTVFQNQEIVRATFAGYIVKSYKNPGDPINKGDILFLMRTREASAQDSVNINLGGGEFSGLVKLHSRTSGVLTELDFQSGNYVSEGDKLAIVVEPRSLKIMLNVPFRYASLISSSGTYSLRLPDGKIHQAKVIRKIPSIDPASQTQTFILEPVPFTAIPANLNLTVKIPVKHAGNAAALPKSSVISNETQTEFWVMKAVNDTLAVRLNIKKGIETDSLVQITDPPISKNDRFIADGAYGLPDTAKIIIKK